jgi:hypothetical protein
MAKSKTELKLAIDNLETVLNSGASTVSVDGETTVFNLDSARERLRDLQSELRELEGRPARRPLFNRINLR